jgi:plastocyanin
MHSTRTDVERMTGAQTSWTARLARLFGWLAASALVAVALVPMPALAAPATWSVKVGAQTPDKGVQANGFFNNNITVDVGDRVTWSWAADEIHTVTFLSGAPEPTLFAVIGGQLVPNFPFLGPSGGPDYNGTGIANSGVFGFPGVPTTFSLTFTTPGTYGYVCLVHEGMDGTVTVNQAGTAYPATQADYDRASQAQEAQLLGKGLLLFGQGQATAAPTEATAGNGQVVSGVGSTLAVLRFVPDKRVVHVGDTVTWRNLDPETPHTVTFGTEPPGGPFGAYAPSSNVSGGHATISSPNDSVNSGFIANDPLFHVKNTFSATFMAPGTYPYICALHDEQGMKGSIVVLP